MYIMTGRCTDKINRFKNGNTSSCSSVSTHVTGHTGFAIEAVAHRITLLHGLIVLLLVLIIVAG